MNSATHAGVRETPGLVMPFWDLPDTFLEVLWVSVLRPPGWHLGIHTWQGWGVPTLELVLEGRTSPTEPSQALVTRP